MPEFLKPEQVQRALQISTTKLNSMIKAGEVPIVRIGNRKRIPAAWLDQQLEQAMAAIGNGKAVQDAAAPEA